jgi:hypothetical protein
MGLSELPESNTSGTITICAATAIKRSVRVTPFLNLQCLLYAYKANTIYGKEFKNACNTVSQT